MTLSNAPSTPGAFLRLIEFTTENPDEMEAIIGRWALAIGVDRTARWYATCVDRDRPGVFAQIVEFPSYKEAMANSGHLATAEFAADLAAYSAEDRSSATSPSSHAGASSPAMST